MDGHALFPLLRTFGLVYCRCQKGFIFFFFYTGGKCILATSSATCIWPERFLVLDQAGNARNSSTSIDMTDSWEISPQMLKRQFPAADPAANLNPFLFAVVLQHNDVNPKSEIVIGQK